MDLSLERPEGYLFVRRVGEHIRFEAEDRGPGLEPEVHARMFDSFFRGEHRAGGSLGLGLALVRRIAQAHGGEAFAETREGGGARIGFSVAAG